MTVGMVIVGAGQAGIQAAESLRSGGYQNPVVIFGEESAIPYHRPPLSKAWLAGEVTQSQLVMRTPEALARKGIELRSGVRVARIDTNSRQAELNDGSFVGYEGLVLATGSKPRLPDIAGVDAQGVHLLRTMENATALSAGLDTCAKGALPIVVIGGGFIGLEVAATARKLDLKVTVFEAAPRLLGRVATPMLSDWYAGLHAMHGVEVELEAAVARIETKDGKVVGVTLRDGRFFPSSLVLIGVGAQANEELAREAGITCDRGIVVDQCARTSAPYVVAAGDCTTRRLPEGGMLRLESVHNAVEQGRSAAAALLGEERPFASTPWFWSDQYDKKLQIAGLATGVEQSVIRGSLKDDAFSVYHFSGDRLVSVDSLNSPKDHLLARKLIGYSVSLEPRQAEDVTFNLSSLLNA